MINGWNFPQPIKEALLQGVISWYQSALVCPDVPKLRWDVQDVAKLVLSSLGEIISDFTLSFFIFLQCTTCKLQMEEMVSGFTFYVHVSFTLILTVIVCGKYLFSF